jgi:acyl-CoA thioesterase FadM
MLAPMFPAPPRPELPANQHAATEGWLRYEDITQDGRLIPIAIPPALSSFWRAVLVKHPGANAAGQSGILPILTRLTIQAHDQPIRVDRAIESNAGFELAHDRDASGEVSRLFMLVWCDVSGQAGRIVPRTPAGPITLAGQVFAEHVFTRPFGPPDQRRITRLQVPGYPELPEMRYPAPAPSTAGEAPDGALWFDDLAPDTTDVVFTLDQTDSNQHVNSLVYIRIFLDAVNRRLAHLGRPLNVRSRAVDIAYRKPCFAGDRVRCHVRLFDRGGTLGAAGFVAVPGEEQKPRCYVRVTVGP